MELITPLPNGIYDDIVALRRQLHRFPELGNNEVQTARIIQSRLENLGLNVRPQVGGHGLVCDIPGTNPSLPWVALRADMDALPIQEETGLDFASEVDGIMHACGHDGHSAMLVGAAHLLSAEKPVAGIRLLWQPAEELGSGAQAMIADGVMDGVGFVFGGHVDRRYPAGVLVVTEGAVNASTDTFTIRIFGQGGHGARPHEAVDAVVVGSLLVTALQTIVSREVDPAHPSVVTIGKFEAGSAANVIAGQATLEGTIRAQEQLVRQHLQQSITRIAQSIAALHSAQVEVSIIEGTPPVINAKPGYTLAWDAAQTVAGPDSVVPLHTANMGGEDFAHYLSHAPGSYIRFGAQIPGREGYPAHSSRFDFDEAALATGARWYCQVGQLAGAYLQLNA